MKGMKFPGMGGMGNMQGMLQRVQKMQAEMQKAQADLQARTFESGEEEFHCILRFPWKVTVTGKKELTGIVIDPQVVDPDDVEMLQDLVLAAVNDALHQVDAVSEAEMNKITGGMKIPGM